MRLPDLQLRRLLTLGAGLLAALILSHCSSPPKVGAACAKDDDCSGGNAAVCLTNAVYPHGYCSRFCASDTDCGEGAFCETSTGTGLCVTTCTATAQCRTADGYTCYAPDVDAGRQGCLPVYPTPDAGTPHDGG